MNHRKTIQAFEQRCKVERRSLFMTPGSWNDYTAALPTKGREAYFVACRATSPYKIPRERFDRRRWRSGSWRPGQVLKRQVNPQAPNRVAREAQWWGRGAADSSNYRAPKGVFPHLWP